MDTRQTPSPTICHSPGKLRRMCMEMCLGMCIYPLALLRGAQAVRGHARFMHIASANLGGATSPLEFPQWRQEKEISAP